MPANAPFSTRGAPCHFQARIILSCQVGPHLTQTQRMDMSSGFEIHQKRLLATWWDRNGLVWESVLKLPLIVWVTSRESWGALAWMDQP